MGTTPVSLRRYQTPTLSALGHPPFYHPTILDCWIVAVGWKDPARGFSTSWLS